LCVQRDILAAIAYFDIFNYPVTQAEIHLFLREPAAHSIVSAALGDLQREGWIYSLGDCYSLQDDFGLLHRRRLGNVKAREMLHKADRIAAFLSAFPFVRGVAVSGSLSKNYADEASDIDFFIITASGRLWLARSILHCFKKFTFLFHKQHLFCMNYFVDEAGLKIREQNLYTATEVVTLIPLRGIKAFHDFYKENLWTRDFLPNHTMKISYVEPAKSPFHKKIAEIVLSNPLGNLLDYLLMKLTAFRWLEKTRKKKRNRRGIVMGMDASRHYAKPDPENFQKKLIQVYEQKIFNLFRRFESRVKSIY